MSYQTDESTPEVADERADDSPRFVKLILAILAIAGFVVPGFQKLYLRQRVWFGVYFCIGMLWFSPNIWLKLLSCVPRLLSLAEGLWVWSMDNGDFETRFNTQQARLSWKSSTRNQVGEDDNDREELPDEPY